MLDIKKLKEWQKTFDEGARLEYFEEMKRELIDFTNSSFYKSSFIDSKSKKDLKQSSRVLNNWEKEGLINESDGKWKKYNKIDSVWLEIISQLREFGFSLEKIKVVKNQLFTSKIKRFIPIEYAIIYSVVKSPMILLIDLDGKINLMPKNTYAKRIFSPMPTPFIYFDISSLIRNEFPNNTFDDFINEGEDISEDELHLLYFIRSGDYENIKIKIENGEILFLEAQKNIEVSEKIFDIIRKKSYQDIEIKRQDGKIVSIKTTEKIKLKK